MLSLDQGQQPCEDAQCDDAGQEPERGPVKPKPRPECEATGDLGQGRTDVDNIGHPDTMSHKEARAAMSLRWSIGAAALCSGCLEQTRRTAATGNIYAHAGEGLRWNLELANSSCL